MIPLRAIVGFGVVVFAAALIGAGCDEAMRPPEPEPPLTPVSFSFPGAPEMAVPEDNPSTVEGVRLGRMLFYDPILSRDSTLACAGCHQQSHAFGDPRRFSPGLDGIEGARHAPSIANAGWVRNLFWDGRARGLEEQALEPVENPIEMASSWSDVEEKLRRHPSYPDLFRRVFGTDVPTREHVTKAIAQFERSLVSRTSRYDRWVVGQAAFTPEEERGWAAFHTERAECFHCHHPNELMTNNLFHNIGLDSMVVDVGRAGHTNDPNDVAKFKAPTLRNVARTAPYMHDGRFQSLGEVLDHYRRGGEAGTGTVDPLIRTGKGLPLTDQDVSDIISFLHTLTDDAFLSDPAHASPF